MQASRCRARWSGMVCVFVAAIAGTDTSHAGILFSDDFDYPIGELAGNSGGSGWAVGNPWVGGTSANGNLVAQPLPGTVGKSISIARGAVTRRPLNTTYVSGSTPYYVSFVFNADPFQGAGLGQFAGVSVLLTGTDGNNLTMGMPGDTGGLGFDWTYRGQPAQAASNATNYLSLYEIIPGSGTTTTVTMYTTTDLTMSGTALAATTPWVSMSNEQGFSFDTVEIGGGFTSGTISLAGLAMATTPSEAVAFTQNAVVPEPSAVVSGCVAVACSASALAWRRRRRRRQARAEPQR